MPSPTTAAAPSETPGSTPSDPRATVPETVDGGDVQVLELRGTIIRLRRQLDQIHARYEEDVRRLESLHRAQRRDLEDTIRHLRERLEAGAVNDG